VNFLQQEKISPGGPNLSARSDGQCGNTRGCGVARGGQLIGVGKPPNMGRGIEISQEFLLPKLPGHDKGHLRLGHIIRPEFFDFSRWG